MRLEKSRAEVDVGGPGGANGSAGITQATSTSPSHVRLKSEWAIH
jgi:hypothetical protein